MVTRIARDLGLDQTVLRRWVQLERGGVMEMNPSKPLRAEAISELQRVQRELKRVTMERDISKRSVGVLREGTAVKYAHIVRQRGVWPTRSMCRMLAVSASGFYEWIGRGASARSQENTTHTVYLREFRT